MIESERRDGRDGGQAFTRAVTLVSSGGGRVDDPIKDDAHVNELRAHT
jgi:hypothetical protein